MKDALKNEWIENLRMTLNAFSPVPDDEWERALPGLSYSRIPKDGYFVRAGDVPQRLAFIAKGLFRVVFVSEKGDEKTLVFREEGRLISAFSPFLASKPSWFSIQALEDSDLVLIGIENTDWTREADCWKTIYAKYMEMLFVEKEEREREFLSEDAETRYRNFRKRYPLFEERIPQYCIASYLGITPVALSRIRSSMK